MDKYYNKETNNVVGEDIPFHEPENPWIKIDNNGEKTPDKIVDKIMIAIKKDKILDWKRLQSQLVLLMMATMVK